MRKATQDGEGVRDGTAPEHELLPNRRLALEDTLGLLVATALLFVLVAFEGSRTSIQALDEAFLRLAVSVRADPLTSIGHFLNVAGSGWITTPIRIAVVVYLVMKRRWWHCGAFALAIVASEIAVTVFKPLYARPRPPGSLVATSGWSFPSGHAIATATTAVSLVIALLPRGSHRLLWAFVAALFSLAMAVSRAYLAAHWLSDAVAGTLLGTTIAMGAALSVQLVRDARVDEGRGGLDSQRGRRVKAPAELVSEEE